MFLSFELKIVSKFCDNRSFTVYVC